MGVMGWSCSGLPCLSLGHTCCELDHMSFWSRVPRERSLKWFLPALEPGPWAKRGGGGGGKSERSFLPISELIPELP